MSSTPLGSTVLGYPRIGPDRELKRAVERYWAGTATAAELAKTAEALRAQTWTELAAAGLGSVPGNTFSYYDQVLDAALVVGAVPERCDLLIAADSAVFGQPEIKLGVIPGIGGSQRLTRAVGKAKAMDLCLTGRTMDAVEAERAGLVSRLVPAADLLTEALRVAATIAAMSTPAAIMAKEAVNRSFETSLAEGVRFERRLFHATFATADQKEGMAAFLEKRPPVFRRD
ncbi:MAG TPA: enoyl-CoA hydratase-related protein [Pseudonocardia sp.]|nr:enoyl-CoA hydratase-related protein [Pseudonocardia sp.]